MNICTKDECEFQDKDGYCTTMWCIYEEDEETLGDIEYHRRVDEGRMR